VRPVPLGEALVGRGVPREPAHTIRTIHHYAGGLRPALVEPLDILEVNRHVIPAVDFAALKVSGDLASPACGK
jgi:hypothetical protein